MKQGADIPMSLPTIAEGVEATHSNASQLVEEADTLQARERWARAFALAHFAREELAKIPLLLIAGTRVANARSVEWPKLRQLLKDHRSKWQIVLADLVRERDYLADATEARLREELSVVAYMGKLILTDTFKDRLVDALWHDGVSTWGRRRETSIYVEEVKGAFKRPIDRIKPGAALGALSRARTAVRYYEPLLPAVTAFLAEPPTTAPWPYVVSFRGRMASVGVGGGFDNDLLS